MQKNYEFKDGIVSVIDLLATKNIQEDDMKEFIHDLEGFILDSHVIGGFNFHNCWGQISRAFDCNSAAISFSDTIVIAYTMNETEKYLSLMADQLVKLVCHGINKKRFFRGVINVGKLYISNDYPIILGPAINEASELYEATDWLGVSLCPKASKFLDDSNSNDLKQYFIKYPDIPWKESSTKSSWALNWPKNYEHICTLCETDSDVIPDDLLTKLKESCDKVENPTEVKKYENSIKFYNYVMNSSDTFH